MTLGAPVANAALYLIEKVATALISQASEVANEACDRMLVACAEQNGKPQTPCPNRAGVRLRGAVDTVLGPSLWAPLLRFQPAARSRPSFQRASIA